MIRATWRRSNQITLVLKSLCLLWSTLQMNHHQSMKSHSSLHCLVSGPTNGKSLTSCSVPSRSSCQGRLYSPAASKTSSPASFPNGLSNIWNHTRKCSSVHLTLSCSIKTLNFCCQDSNCKSLRKAAAQGDRNPEADSKAGRPTGRAIKSAVNTIATATRPKRNPALRSLRSVPTPMLPRRISKISKSFARIWTITKKNSRI